MKGKSALVVLLIGFLSFSACDGQSKKHSMKNETNNNPLLCDPQTGVCEMPVNDSATQNYNTLRAPEKTVKIIYYTDPICSSCWGIEPQLRKLKLEFGNVVDIEYRMGGLLPDWSYNSGGISKPADVASHWDEVSLYYDMPIDGDVWLEDPLHSSYPPSIAFKAAQMQDNEKALLFLREIREMVFLQKKNITKWTYLEEAAKRVALDIVLFKADFEGKANLLFKEDLKLGRTMGVRGFPTMFFKNSDGKTEMVYGSRPYAAYENAILKLLPNAKKQMYDKSPEAIFLEYPTLTAKEFSELTETSREEAQKTLDEMTADGTLEKYTTKNGAIWKLINTSN
ncbi:Predicted dithiol-disulfide isomerase, DsbA family [Zhouia amylolytica]|uniref:Predicted dithiol-disulfide isomerase, DsbA family n=2 Tax=Zhouia amylolytica TaxID=376730 RepID=A0A1I6SAG1_9FLAO|nr:Predicted dithiol-disulfide isomerase, DsbA family [Zhouia amylolytica]